MLSESKILLNQFLPNIIQTVISFAIVAVCTSLVYYIFFKKTDTKKHQNIIRKRLIYMMLVIDLLILTKIWVDGFSHIITVLSLMAAGLVVANKESVMNLIGGLIISWRDLFVEGDFIQIQNYSGYVSSIGIMYFRLYETIAIDRKQATGHTIKIPNSLVITSPVVNFSPGSNLCLQKIVVRREPDQPLAGQLKKVSEIITRILGALYKDNPCYKRAYVKSHNRELSHLINLQPAIFLEQWVDKEVELRIVVQFYCFPNDQAQIMQQFWLEMD